MERRHKFLWLRGTQWWDYTYDGAYETPLIKKNEKVQCRKMKRRYFKNITEKEIKAYERDDC